MRLIILVVLNLSSMFANPIVDVRSDGVADDYRGFRLPNIQIPSKYEVSLFLNQSVFDGSVTSFNGTARITFQVTKKTDKIQIHSSVTHSSIELENSTIGIITPSLNGTTEILTIPLNSTLEPSVNYFLVIKYTGQIDIRTMKGFYRSSFNNENGSIEYLLTTQFQPTHARKAFPCFDEPQFKARFVISITYPKGYKALSNSPRENLPVDLGTGYETTTFKETPLTSTYLIAFIVSKFTCTGGINIDTDVPYQYSMRNFQMVVISGAAIFRMVENFMGTDNFYNGIRSYLNTKANKSAVPEDLWLALQPHYLQLNVSEIMTNWTIHAGFPLVMVTSSGNDVVLSQKRFLYSGEDDTQWYIPISYTVSSDPNKFESVSPKIWLKPGTTETIPNVLETNSWIILNNKESAYYRVNYDSSLWSRIERALRTDHTQIDVLNRAQIVDDSLNLARAGILKYSEVLKILNYLKNETDYYPWSSALGGLNFLTVRLGEGSVLGKKVESLMLDLMEGVYRSVSFTDLTEYDQIYTLKLVLVLRRACKLAKADCLNTAKVLFKDFKDGKSVDKNRKSIVYCYGLRYSEDVESDWTFMWDKYQNTSLSTEQVTILSTLGCTNNTNLLKKYLDLSINGSSGIRTQELPTVWSSVYSSNPEGVDVALDYLVENHQKIYQYYPEAASLIANVAARLSRDDQVKKLESFVALETLHPSMKSAATSAIDSVKANIKWTSNIKSDLEQYFNEDNNNSTTSTAPVTPVTPAGAANISLSVSLMAIIVIMIFDICFP
nr:aminopeptidase N-like [Leptinotarsa decemlineata]